MIYNDKFYPFWQYIDDFLNQRRDLFRFWEKHGFHIVPDHFYETIPNIQSLKDNLWQKRSKLVGIDINEENQIKLISEFYSLFKEEYDKFPKEKTSDPHQFYINNGSFESVDCEILYCMIRYFKPKKIVETGSGFSTLLSAQAILKNKKENNIDCELIAIEPYPWGFLKTGFLGLKKLISKKIQEIPLIEFDQLKRNDIFFVDTSHVLKIGSDVQYLFLEILPRLNKGVIIHFHDIFIPSDYPKSWILKSYRFYNEQYLLQTFMVFNKSFEVLWAGSYMHLKNADRLETTFKSYNRDKRWPGSFWIRRID